MQSKGKVGNKFIKKDKVTQIICNVPINAKEKLQVNCHMLGMTYTLRGVLNRLNEKIRKPRAAHLEIVGNKQPYCSETENQRMPEKHDGNTSSHLETDLTSL